MMTKINERINEIPIVEAISVRLTAALEVLVFQIVIFHVMTEHHFGSILIAFILFQSIFIYFFRHVLFASTWLPIQKLIEAPDWLATKFRRHFRFFFALQPNVYIYISNVLFLFLKKMFILENDEIYDYRCDIILYFQTRECSLLPTE
jgi:hypothetical protein